MSEQTAIVMIGAAGRMGRQVLSLAASQPDRYRIAGAVDHQDCPELGKPLAELIANGPEEVKIATKGPSDPEPGTVVIDFSLPPSTIQHLSWARRHGLPEVIATTGFSDDQRREIEAATRDCPIVLTSNTSLGVNAFFALAEQAVKMLGPGYDLEIVEMHHRHKKDAPSGTARTLAERVAQARGLDYAQHARHGRHGDVGARPDEEIGIHALRGGDVVGDHTLILAGPNERIEIRHQAQSRELFAQGALVIADWLKDRKPGFYSMKDVLGLE